MTLTQDRITIFNKLSPSTDKADVNVCNLKQGARVQLLFPLAFA